MIGRTLTLSCNKNEAPYATILALNGGGFSAQKSVVFNDENSFEFNLDGLRIRNEITVARIIAQSAGKADLIGYNCFERMKY
uniref:Ig-like domain-containing protein n=1 Tax=Heterorhabditis bacteriophora TaxID=37862 RepID=A0A1I7WPB1_HETBA